MPAHNKTDVDAILGTGVEVTQVENLPLVHTMLRTIVTVGAPQGDAMYVEQVDAETSWWITQGYKLVNTHFLGEIVEGLKVLYIFAKQ